MNMSTFSTLFGLAILARVRCALASAAAALIAVTAGAQGLPQIPVFLKEPVPPNVLFTVDNSGSMAWSYTPDLPTWRHNNSQRGFVHPALLANDGSVQALNPLAYNPNEIYKIPLRADGTPFPVSFNGAYRFGLLPDVATVSVRTLTPPGAAPNLWNTAAAGPGGSVNLNNLIDLATAFRPTMQVAQALGISEITIGADTAAYYTRRATTLPAGCPSATSTDALCFEQVTVGASSGVGSTDERANFAIWYSFYRTRHLALKTGLIRALFDLDPTTRVTWQSFVAGATNRCHFRGIRSNDCPNSYNPAVVYDNQLAPFSAGKRAVLIKWLTELESDTNTPLRTAFVDVLNYTGLTGANNPWGDAPGTTEAPINACRSTYHVAVTDGLYNDFPTPLTPANRDGNAMTLPDGKAYTPAAPFSDGSSSMLADLAFRAWATDASTASNIVTPFASKDVPKNPLSWANADYWNPEFDPATWQHVNTFTIGIGLGSYLTNPAWAGSTFKSVAGVGFNSFASGAAQWDATAGRPANAELVYDLWHAAVNGRGGFYSADRPEDIYNAFQEIFGRIGGREGSASGSAASSSFVSNDTKIFSASYKAGDWSGEITSTPVNLDGSLGTPLSSDGPMAAIVPSTRMIFTRNLSVPAASPPVEFKWALLSTASKAAVSKSTNDPDMLNFFRGDRSFEFGNASCAGAGTCKFRKRSKLLGDVLSSSPVYSKSQDYGYRSETWSGAGVPYFNYLKKKTEKSGILLVGANDGMLHGFDPTDLTEKFAYIPSVLQSKLWRLAEPSYIKQAYVDGPVGLGDAYIGGGWRTIALATLGAGGRSVSALDVSPGISYGPSQLLWEFTDPDLGNLLSRPIVTRLSNGNWVALFSGGFASPNGTATLFSVDLSSGTLMQKIEFPNATDACNATRATARNGLGAVTVAKNKAGQIKIYAGDLYGKLWRLSESGGTISIDFSEKPLLKACNADTKAQPITAAPAVTVLGADQMVLVGTGRMITAGDTSNIDIQSFYGVISDNDSSSIALSRTTRLGQRTVTTSGSGRTVSNNKINLVNKRGWFVDLPAAGERLNAAATIVDGRVVFATFVPDITQCESNGDSWVFNLDLNDGAPPTSALFSATADGGVDSAGKVGGVFAAAAKFDGTITGFTQIKNTDRPRTATAASVGGGGTDVCGKGKVKLVANKLYKSGANVTCSPSESMRSGWRQIR